ncbi:MAG: alpha-(1-_3)-arabinofuranosyltransferase family protein [Actinomycetota bacterium]|nr:alpha-(1->3)-arabinofuranosyltransferase family protein [Actinomycetota bacterium]
MQLPGRLAPRRLGVLLLAALAYVPALASSPGRMPADTKLYLYLDPGGLMGTAAQSWDTGQFGGWVPHQAMSYLWPSGPWFWACEQIGLPDWVAHRLWLGTLLFLGGWGVLRLARHLGLATTGALVAALVYQLAPYTLPYVSRTSLMLLPWASLGWLTLLTIRSFRNGGWRDPALFALVIFTVAGVNATAFLMIVPGPMAWVLIEWCGKRLSTRRVLATTGRLAVLSGAVSLWWVTMLSVQGTNGADVLAYSETLDAVSLTSTSTEVMRGLGYWLFYIRDPYASATTSSIPYQESPKLIVVGFALLMLCALGFLATRWAARRFAVALVALGVVLSVGVHPFQHPAPLLSLIRDTGLGLALRSSTRALPLLSLGLGLSLGALVVAAVARATANGPRWSAARIVLPAFAVLLVFANIPSLWRAQLVDPALARDQQPPAAWMQAAAELDRSDLTTRVLQLPGSEFGAFRWGYTVDPPLPGITDKPLITRDLLPLGSVGVMDLLYALDNRVQQGTLDPRAVAPVARLLAADRIWLSNDLAFDRFRTPRPEPFAGLLTAPVAGLGDTQSYGTPAVNVPDIPMVDEQSLSDQLVGTPIAPVQLRAVTDPVGMARVGSRVVILDGSGDGIVDASAAGLLVGDEAIFYANDLTLEQWQALGADAYYVVTDSNRDRDQQWRGSQDALGMTEEGGPATDGVQVDAGDQRLPLFDGTGAAGNPESQTVAVLEAGLDGGLVVQATSYGEPFAFLPEARAAMAVDGDPATSWRTGQRWDAVGQTITVSSVADGQLRLVQPQGRQLRLMITAVDIASGGAGGAVQRVELTDASLTTPGQRVDVPAGSQVAITIAAVGPRPDAPETGENWVGFAELGPVATEYVRPPTTVLAGAQADDALAIVFHRDRVRGTDRWRADPEPLLARRFDVTDDLGATLSLTLRLNSRAPDEVLNLLAGWAAAPAASDRLAGVPAAAASAAFDGDNDTRWISAFNTPLGTTLTVPLDPTVELTSFSLQQPTGDFSRITEVGVTVGDQRFTLPVPTPNDGGVSRLSFPAVRGEKVLIEVAGIDARYTTDRRYGEQVVLPVALTEVLGLPVRAIAAPAAGECRDDLLVVDGRPVPLAVDVAALRAGGAVEARTCTGEPITLSTGEHRLLSTNGLATGIDVDEVVLQSAAAAAAAAAVARSDTPAVVVQQHSDTEFTMQVQPCPDGCWLIFGQGYNTGWEASAAGASLGAAVPVSGGFSGWWLPPSTAPTTVSAEFAPQTKVSLALWLSALAVLCCVVLVVWRRREPAGAAATGTVQLVSPLSVAPGRRQWLTGAALVVCTTLLVAPSWGVAALVVAGGALALRRPQLMGVAGLGLVAAVMALVARRQWVYRYPANAAWPGNFENLHRVGLFAILLLATAFFATGDGAAEPAEAAAPAGDGTGLATNPATDLTDERADERADEPGA